MASVPQQLLATRADRRMVPRSEMCLGVTLHKVGEAETIPAGIANLSATGFLAELPAITPMPDVLDVDLPNAGRRKAYVVWHSGTLAGCTFTRPLSKADLSAARLKSEYVDPSAPRPPALDPADPIWNIAGEATPEERWPLGTRVAVVAGAALACWAPVIGVAALII